MALWHLRCGVAAVSLAVAAGAAHAQSSVNDSIRSLQQQIQSLQQQLQQLQNQVNTQAQQPAPAPTVAVAPAAPPAPPVVASPGAPPIKPAYAIQSGPDLGIESADGNYSINLTGRLHLDMGGYAYSHFDPGALGDTFNAGFNARRARIGVDGKFAGDFLYTVIYDFGGSSDSTGSHNLENAYITYNGLYGGPVPLAFDLGYLDTPFTLDEATSSNDIMFMERAGIQQAVTNLFANDQRATFGVRSNNDRYWAGVYVTGPQYGDDHVTTATAAAPSSGVPIGAFGRASYQFIQTSDASLHLGVDLGGLIKPPHDSAAGTGFGAIGVTGTTLSSNPEISINAPTLLSTGVIGSAANPVQNSFVYGFETAAGYQNYFLQGEYYGVQVNRQGLSTNNFDGGYVEASWTVTGEHRAYKPASGAYSAINPEEPFSIAAGTWGALELAARFSLADFNDSQGLAADNQVFGGRQIVYGLGVNWYLNSNMRIMFDYLHGLVKKFTPGAGVAPGVESGADYDALATRFQLEF